MSSSREKPSRDMLAAAFGTLRGAFISVGVFSMVINLLMLTGPLFMLQIYDRVLASGSIPTLMALAVIAIVLYGFFGALEALRARVLFRVARRLDEKLSTATFLAHALLPLKTGAFGEKIEPVGDLDRIRQFAASPGPTAFFDLPWMPLYVGIIFLFHTWLGYVALAGAITLFVLAVLNELVARAPNGLAHHHAATRKAWSDSARRNIESVNALGMLPAMVSRWDGLNQAFVGASNQAADRNALFSSATKTLRFMLQSAILGLGAYLAIQQQITPGVMIAASIIMSRAVAPVELVVGHWPGFLAARQALGRLRATLAEETEASHSTDLPLPKKALKVTDLAVAPPGTTQPTTQGIRFALQAGDGLGIIGPSASGKSSLARALVGVWPVIKGSVRLDGATLDQWPPERLGCAIGYLPQSVELLDGKISEVIGRFDPTATSEDVLAAAQMAGVHDMIVALPDGYDTQIGQDGTALSAGQRQRLGLARALFRAPFLIVLDEPNSNLDAEGDAALQSAIRALRDRGSIVIVIAHRPSTLEALDTVLVLGGGRQQAFGPKDEVLKALAVPKSPGKGGLSVVADGA